MLPHQMIKLIAQVIPGANFKPSGDPYEWSTQYSDCLDHIGVSLSLEIQRNSDDECYNYLLRARLEEEIETQCWLLSYNEKKTIKKRLRDFHRGVVQSKGFN